MEMMFRKELKKNEAHERINSSNNGTTISTEIKIKLIWWEERERVLRLVLYM